MRQRVEVSLSLYCPSDTQSIPHKTHNAKTGERGVPFSGFIISDTASKLVQRALVSESSIPVWFYIPYLLATTPRALRMSV